MSINKHSPGCNCCTQVCNVYTWDVADELNDWIVDSGTWLLDEPASEPSNTFITCTAAGELIYDGDPIPAQGYAALRIRGTLVDQEVSLKIYNGSHSAVMKITFGEDGVDDASTLSIKVDGVEQYTTLPQRSDLVAADDLDHNILLHCIWTSTYLRVEVELVNTDSTYAFRGIGTRIAIDWTPDSLSIIADPLTDVVRIQEVVIDRLETDAVACVLEVDCQMRTHEGIPAIPRIIGSQIGEWDLTRWNVDEYTSDATYTGNPNASPAEGTNVIPLGISITEENRAYGYVVGANVVGAAAMNVGTWYHLSSLFADGDNIEVKWYGKRTQFSPSLFQWRGDLYVGGSLVDTGDLINGPGLGTVSGGMSLWVGGTSVYAVIGSLSVHTDPPYLSATIASTFNGERVRAAAGADATQHRVESISAYYCAGPNP
jgi:hypothetical protein